MDIRDSLQLILATGNPQFSERFYRNFFEHYPEIQELFEGVNLKRQGILLTIALQVVVEHYLRPHLTMKNYLRLLGHKHHQLGVQEADYQGFGVSLLTTLEEFHGGQWDSDLATEWRTAYDRASQQLRDGHTDDFEII